MQKMVVLIVYRSEIMIERFKVFNGVDCFSQGNRSMVLHGAKRLSTAQRMIQDEIYFRILQQVTWFRR